MANEQSLSPQGYNINEAPYNTNPSTWEGGGSGGGEYVLPTASATVKGGVKIGSGLQMTGEVLSAIGGGGGGSTLSWTSGEYETSGIGSEGGPAEGAILGVYTQMLLKKEPSNHTSIEFVNEDDPSDTITLYNTNDTATEYGTDYIPFNNPLIGVPTRYTMPPSPLSLFPLGETKAKITTGQSFPLYKTDSGELEDGDTIWAQVVEGEMTVSFYVRSFGAPYFSYGGYDGCFTKLVIYITDDPEAEEPVTKTYIAEGIFGYYDFYSTDEIRLQGNTMIQS